MSRSRLLFLTGLGSGLSPWAPGTMGTLVGVVLYLLLFSSLPAFWYLAFTALLFWLGALASNHGEEIWGEEDSPSIVIDEVVGFLIAMIGISPSFWSVVLGFLLFRFWDIWKPFEWIEELPGGWGVMADDALAGIITCAMLHFMV